MKSVQNPQVLVVEDDLQLRTLYVRAFQGQEFGVLTAAGVLDARGILATLRPAAVILDIGLEDDSGLQLLAELPASAVVIVVTGHQEKDLVREVLASGADDLVFKPFGMDELVARVLGRIEAMRRSPGMAWGEAACLQVDLGAAVVSCERDGRSTGLSARETATLQLLLDARGEVVSRETISERIHGEHWDPSSRRVDALVSRLRRKLDCDRCGAQRALSTAHNHGYRLSGPLRRRG